MEQLNRGGTNEALERLRSEWRLAEVALGVILLFVVSWTPYSAVALTATAGYAHILTPYMNSVPAVIAEASAIHNPIIYAITHPKYRAAIGRYVPLPRPLLVFQLRRRFISSKHARRSELAGSLALRRRPDRQPLGSDGESWTEREADGSGAGSTDFTRQQ